MITTTTTRRRADHFRHGTPGGPYNDKPWILSWIGLERSTVAVLILALLTILVVVSRNTNSAQVPNRARNSYPGTRVPSLRPATTAPRPLHPGSGGHALG
eukprot:2489329-Rhodomonas_salina.1